MTRRGEIYLVDWSSGRGSEQAGVRPALVIQNNVGNEFSPTTIVAAVSTRVRRKYPFHVAVTARESGLPKDSTVKCEQIHTVAQSRLTSRIGELSPAKMLEVNMALRHSLGLEG